ncbi:hypothetical protein [Mesorhizobium sp. LNHC232B00]|uniref:hypothetical protein n=1 Tax=Mesorhizobium sp. LNHC232B00 TaxID=1287243 RepID=UPI0004127F7F|nr:hypothetical protein [Mesorhizobium sp. LNHC232B00]
MVPDCGATISIRRSSCSAATLRSPYSPTCASLDEDKFRWPRVENGVIRLAAPN